MRNKFRRNFFVTGSESPIPAHHTVVFSNEEEIVSIENSSKENAAELLLIAGKLDYNRDHIVLNF